MTTVVKSRSEVTFVLLFFATLAICGILAGNFFVKDFARARSSAGWPTADGVVLSQLGADSDSVRYAYSFAGRSYQSTRDRVFIARISNRQDETYAPGQTVSVFVNPKDPSFSVLHPGGAGLPFLALLIFSGVCIFFGVGGVIWTFSEGVDASMNDAPHPGNA